MIKNNQGFAMASMLYGILAITILILASILSVLRSNYTTNNDLAYSIGETLDKCSKRQTLMNDCYLNGGDCLIEKSNYNACVGVSDSGTTVTSFSTVDLANTLLSSNTVKAIKIDDADYYYFQGANPNNYINYEGKLGRILFFETSGTMKVVFENQNTTTNKLYWDDTDDKSDEISIEGLWTSSRLYYYLNQDFFNTFTDISRINDRSWNVGNIYIDQPFYGTNGYFDREKTSRSIQKVGLPTISEVFLASSNQACSLNSEINVPLTSAGCLGNNWMLSTSGMWLANGVASSDRTILESNAYTISNTSLRYVLKNNQNQQVKPALYISSANVKNNGSGSASNPYEIY